MTGWTVMRIDITKEEMLAIWMRRHFFEPLRADCVMSRSDGVDLEAIAVDEMRRWYVRMLGEAPAGMLAPVDIALTVAMRRTPQDTGIIMLPDNVVRVLAVKLSGWEREAAIVTGGSAMCRLQGNRYSRGGVANPVAVLSPGGRLELFSLGSEVSVPMVETLLVVEDPGPERYVMDERLLGEMDTPE